MPSYSSAGVFEVKESKMLNYIIAFVMAAIALGILLMNSPCTLILTIMSAVTSIVFFKKGSKRAVYMLINHDGIYYQNKLITNWNDFENAILDEEENLREIKTVYTITIFYRDTHSGKTSNFYMVLPDTINKSGEEIIEAMKNYRSISI